jgi:hypothetical protein
MTESTFLVRYEAAKAALEQAVLVDEVLDIRDSGLKMKAYAKIAKDRRLQADAAVIVIRAERKLGVMIQSAHETGQMGLGRRAKSNVSPLHDLKEKHVPETENNGSDAEPLSRVTLKEAGIDKKLSMRAQKWAKLGEGEFDDKLQAERDRIESAGAQPINGARTVQAGRKEPGTSLDYFPTPPWATRALLEEFRVDLNGTVWEPACGEGHIAGVLQEYFDPKRVFASDIFDYGADGRTPPGWQGTRDFLDDGYPLGAGKAVDWIITNPPFSGTEDRALAFALRALQLAKRGVALFVRTQWLEGVERYEKLFGVNPPTVVAQFAERVPLVRGRWDPQASTASQYCWLIWLKDEHGNPCAMQWLPPGRRVELTKADDVERFTARPVKSIQRGEPADAVGQEVSTPLPADRSHSAAPESPAATPEAGGEGDTHASALPAPLGAYEAALAAGAAHHGKHTIATIEPIWRAAIAEGVAGSQVAFDTDSKMGSVLSWKAKLGLAGLGTSGRSAPRKPKVPA